MNLTLGFTDPTATDLSRSGGKGASLARSAQSLPVPGGFIITADAYSAFIGDLHEQISTLIRAGVASGEDASTEDAGAGVASAQDANARVASAEADSPAEAIADLIRATPIPDGWTDEFARAARDAGIADRAVAVRSSGTMEDLPGAAFAGQHDTYLGVRGPQAIAEAVRDCYASLWNPHAFAYRRQLGVDQLDARMAVVVQLMVDVSAEEAAGVAFSVDPVRGNTDEVLINAAFGLGETVVGGEEPVDEFRVARATGSQVGAEVAEKPKALVMVDPKDGDSGDSGSGDSGSGDGDSGDGDSASRTREVRLGEDQRTRPALTEAQQAEVARLAISAEKHFGFPQDIEWAFSRGELFLLQSRPITRVAPRWTRDESAERFPTPVTPLTWDLVEAGFHTSLNHSFHLMGLPPFNDKWFAMRDFYIYGNQTAVDLYAGRLPTAMLESVETITAALPQIAEQFGWIQDLPVTWMRDLDTYLIGIGRLANEPLESKSLAEVWDHVIAISDLGTAYFQPNIAISLTQRTLYGALRHMLSLALDDVEAQVVFERLLASTETKTSQVNAELWELSRRIRADTRLHSSLEANTGEAGLGVLGSFPEFRRAFSEFLDRHGHRELDFDAYHPTWVEVPHIVLDQVRLLADRADASGAGTSADGATGDAAAGTAGASGAGAGTAGAGSAAAAPLTELQRKVLQAETELAVVGAAPEKLRYLVQEVIRLARTYTALDDLEHYETTRLTLPMRRALKELGSRLVARGVLVDPMDVFFLRFSDLDGAIREADAAATSAGDPGTSPLAGLTAVATANKAGYLAAVAHTPDWEYGRPAEVSDADEDVIRGTAGSPGEVEGEVFVVHSPDDFSHFPDGAILVARTTNPAWTALFYQARGVITESGGALSHGAVTARELGLPAVMAVRNATSRFASGQRVRVNGSTGTITEL